MSRDLAEAMLKGEDWEIPFPTIFPSALVPGDAIIVDGKKHRMTKTVEWNSCEELEAYIEQLRHGPA
jgi:hypothetical protein